MTEDILENEKFLTNNFNWSIEFLKHEIEKTNSAYLTLMLAYKYSITEESKNSNLLINKIKLEELSPYLKSLYKMVVGLLYINNKDISLGRNMLEEALGIYNQNKWIRVELYLLLIYTDPVQAWKHLEGALKIDSNFWWARVEQSFGFDEYSNCIEIIENLKDLPDSYNDSEAYNLLSTAYVNCKDFNNAYLTIKKSIEIEETSNNCFSLAQYYHEHEQNFNLGEFYYNKSLSLDSSNIDALGGHSWLMYDKKEYKLAEKGFKKAIEINSNQEIYNQAINFYLKIGNTKSGLKTINQSAIANGKNFLNEGYLIIIKILTKKEYIDSYKSYCLKYNDKAILWLKESISLFLKSQHL